MRRRPGSGRPGRSMTDLAPHRPLDHPPRGLLALSRRLLRWHAREPSSLAWTAAVALVLALVMLPVVVVLTLAVTANDNVWPHLLRTVLPGSLLETCLLLLGVGTSTLIVGAATAWIVTMHRFPGRSVLDRLLVIPLAVPTYIVAYCYVDMLDFTGPLQRALRWVFGWQTAQDYWFPEVRSTGGAIFVMASVLYPYVYLTARASFVQQSV